MKALFAVMLVHVGRLALALAGLRRRRHVAEGGFSMTNLGNLDKIRHDQGWLAEGDFP